MAELPDCGGSFQAAERKSAAGNKSRTGRAGRVRRVTLEKVLGISAASSSALASDPNSGLVAYPAGCVVVLLHPQIYKQKHIINTSRKPFSALAFSCDGRHLVTGERGHLPCVRVWQVDDGAEAAAVQNHKCGVSCVAFSTGGAYVVSVGDQYDMNVCVWDWRKGSILASNKVSSSVSAVSFSEDGSYFVTAGKRHIRFWYLDVSKERRGAGTAPLTGRSGLPGDLRQAVFSGVGCGRGPATAATYAVTRSALLCRFNAGRVLEARVPLEASCAHSVEVTDNFVFCGCSDGLVRVFSPSDMRYITTLPYPHRLGVASPQDSGPIRYPDVLALTFNPAARHLTCVYSDRSVYVWDVGQLGNAKRIHTALYHSAPVWNIEVCGERSAGSQARPPPSWFLTSSSDNTVRQWQPHADISSNGLLRILYVGENTPADKREKSAVRVLRLCPDGRRLATGDFGGVLRLFDLDFLEELVRIEAHDSEILALEFSPSSVGVELLASAGRDRLVRIFNLERGFRLEQTIGDHSAPVVAVKFAGDGAHLRLVSCGADKSVYFYSCARQPHQTAEGGVSFWRTQQALEKTALHDMDADSSGTRVAVACQDGKVRPQKWQMADDEDEEEAETGPFEKFDIQSRIFSTSVFRVYSVDTGKMCRSLKDPSKGGALLKVRVDLTGTLVATCCSDKNISVLDYRSGERLAAPFGHSEPVTCLRFSADCAYLISASVDGCVFVWRLDSHAMMRKRAPMRSVVAAPSIRRETFIVGPARRLPGDGEPETPSGPDPEGAPQTPANGTPPTWVPQLGEEEEEEAAAPTTVPSDAEPAPVRNRWLEKSPLIFLDYSQSFNDTEDEDWGDEDRDFHPQSLENHLSGKENCEPVGPEDGGPDRRGPDRLPPSSRRRDL
ncbi:mitogen-activated protein kinase-binding protein 1-like isoform X2 [Syngnathoides biaculeatus]|uniref:mitogen-activated protein kinase-binding protein 1-like isoform X2 n=1 Tax=Syngnathoides biaculeatus TaxID=300417 RepID=UPI002ADDE621|nr:mitogen-activated protein kinase-binding protein 1-like isoform X2 [Syngnathoides biaculeatus]